MVIGVAGVGALWWPAHPTAYRFLMAAAFVLCTLYTQQDNITHVNCSVLTYKL